MATKRPSVYVGLGGTGIKAIAQAKKMFEDAYGKGKIPGQIAFVAVDYDLSTPNSKDLATDIKDDFLGLNIAASPKVLYDAGVERGEYKWVFGTNARFIGTRISDGASQVRTYGRFLSEMIQDNILRYLRDSILRVKSISNDSEDEAGNQPTDIHIAMSLAGGTGCGSFLNVAQLIRNEFGSNVNIIGYGVLHGVFRAMDPAGTETPRVVANAYSAILDLDYLMSASDENPINVSFNGKKQVLRAPIYDEFYVIDNETERGKKVRHINELCEVVGTCLFASGGDLGGKVQSGKSNHLWKLGNYDISPKLGWAQSLGACQVVYKGDLLADIYGLKAAVHLIQNLIGRTQGYDFNKIAIDWANAVNINEDNADLLIDSIYNMKTAGIAQPPLDIRDSLTDVKNTVNKYVASRPKFPNEEVQGLRKEEIIHALNEKVISLLKADNGVGNTRGFLKALRMNVELYRSQMEAERAEKEEAILKKGDALNNAYREYEEYCKKLFKTDNGKRERLEDIANIAKSILEETLEVERRKVASAIFTSLLTQIETVCNHVDGLNNKLSELQDKYEAEMSEKQIRSKTSRVFEYDLSAGEYSAIEFKAGDNFISGYLTSIGKSLYEVDLATELDAGIISYCSDLLEAKAYREKLIVDVIDELDKEEYEALKREIIEKSSRLLRLDDRGQVMPTLQNALPTTKMAQIYLMSVYQREGKKNRLEEDKSFLNSDGVKKECMHSDFESMKQKMIFYRSDMAIIPYCISAFSDFVVEREYNVLINDSASSGSTSFNPHCDKELFDKMRTEDFKLKPEMKNEALFYWVCGHIFGWKNTVESQYIMEKDKNNEPIKIDHKEDVDHVKYIRYYKGKYQYWEQDVESNDGDWKSLANTTQREVAFRYFKTEVFPKIKDVLHDKVYKALSDRGKGVYKSMVEEIISAGKEDYIDKLLCTDKNSITYKSKNNGELLQINEEWKYIAKSLVNALETLK